MIVVIYLFQSTLLQEERPQCPPYITPTVESKLVKLLLKHQERIKMNSENKTKISKWTIVRTAAMVIVIINMILKANGKAIINVSESEISTFLEYAIEIGVIVANWWYNNSFTENAKKAQEFLEELKESE